MNSSIPIKDEEYIYVVSVSVYLTNPLPLSASVNDQWRHYPLSYSGR